MFFSSTCIQTFLKDHMNIIDHDIIIPNQTKIMRLVAQYLQIIAIVTKNFQK